jgi:hypothetical protein
LWFNFDESRDAIESFLRTACSEFGLSYHDSAIEGYNGFERHHDVEPLQAGRINDLYRELCQRAHRGTLRAVGYEEVIAATTSALDEQAHATLVALHQRVRDLETALKKHAMIAQSHERVLGALRVEIDRTRWPELMSLARRAYSKSRTWWQQRSAAFAGQGGTSHEEPGTIPLHPHTPTAESAPRRLSDAA